MTTLDTSDPEAVQAWLRELVRRGEAWIRSPYQDEPPIQLARMPAPDKVAVLVTGEVVIDRWRQPCPVLPLDEARANAAAWLQKKADDEARWAAERARRAAEEAAALERRAAERQRWKGLPLSERLAEINGRRRTRVLDEAEVLSTARRLASSPLWTAHLETPAGLVSHPSAYRKRGYDGGRATIALLVRVRRAVAVDVALAGGGGEPPRRWESILADPEAQSPSWAQERATLLSLRSLKRGESC